MTIKSSELFKSVPTCACPKCKSEIIVIGYDETFGLCYLECVSCGYEGLKASSSEAALFLWNEEAKIMG